MTEVRKAKYLSILADEVADVSNTEQFSLVLRFVDENNEIKEEFVDFFPCMDGTSSQALADMCIAKACDLQVVRNVIGSLNQVCLFFNTSPKRQALLEQVISRMPESSTRSLLLISAGLVGLLGMTFSMLLENYMR